MRLTAPDGTEHEFTLPIERIIEMEQADPEWSLVSLLSLLSSGRISDADRVLALVGTSYAGFLAMGFGYLDVAKLVHGILSDSGFTTASVADSAGPSQGTS